MSWNLREPWEGKPLKAVVLLICTGMVLAGGFIGKWISGLS